LRDGVKFGSAIRFDERWDSLWERCTLDGYRLPGLAGRLEPVEGHTLPGAEGAAP
jgi:hypothetical protein